MGRELSNTHRFAALLKRLIHSKIMQCPTSTSNFWMFSYQSSNEISNSYILSTAKSPTCGGPTRQFNKSAKSGLPLSNNFSKKGERSHIFKHFSRYVATMTSSYYGCSRLSLQFYLPCREMLSNGCMDGWIVQAIILLGVT